MWRSGTGWGTHREVRDPRGEPDWVKGPSKKSVTGQGTLSEVQNWLGNTLGGPVRVVGPSWWSETGRLTHGKVRDGPGEHRGGPGREGPGRVWEPAGRAGTGWAAIGEVRDWSENLREFRDGLGDPWEDLYWDGSLSRRSGMGRGPSRRCGTVWGTLREVRDKSGHILGGPGRVRRHSRRSGTDWGTLVEFRDGSGDPKRGPRRVRGPSGKSGMGRVTLSEVRDGSGDPTG